MIDLGNLPDSLLDKRNKEEEFLRQLYQEENPQAPMLTVSLPDGELQVVELEFKKSKFHIPIIEAVIIADHIALLLPAIPLELTLQYKGKYRLRINSQEYPVMFIGAQFAFASLTARLLSFVRIS